MFLQNEMNAIEQVTIANRFAFFQKEVGTTAEAERGKGGEKEREGREFPKEPCSVTTT